MRFRNSEGGWAWNLPGGRLFERLHCDYKFAYLEGVDHEARGLDRVIVIQDIISPMELCRF